MAARHAKFEFGSKAWVDQARRYVLAKAEQADLAAVALTFNEVFTDAPAHLGRDALGRIGWFIRVADARVEVGQGILDRADVRVTADYAAVLPLARQVFGGDADLVQAAQRRLGELAEAGKFRTEGDASALADLPWSAGLHDALAAHTA